MHLWMKVIESGFAEHKQSRDDCIGVRLCIGCAECAYCSVNPYSFCWNASQKVVLALENDNASFPGTYSISRWVSGIHPYLYVGDGLQKRTSLWRGTISTPVMYSMYTETFLEGIVQGDTPVLGEGFLTVQIPALSNDCRHQRDDCSYPIVLHWPIEISTKEYTKRKEGKLLMRSNYSL